MGLFSKIFSRNENAVPQTPVVPLDKSQPGSLIIEDISTVTGRGTIVTGEIQNGFFYVGQKAAIVSEVGEIPTVINGVEQFAKTLEYAGPGEKVGLLLQGISRDNVNTGDTIQGITEQQQ